MVIVRVDREVVMLMVGRGYRRLLVLLVLLPLAMLEVEDTEVDRSRRWVPFRCGDKKALLVWVIV